MPRLGERIREVRRALRIKQYEIAKQSEDPDLTDNYISKIENGHEENPGWKKLLSIAKGLGVDVGVVTAPVGSPIPKPEALDKKDVQRQINADKPVTIVSYSATSERDSHDAGGGRPISASERSQTRALKRVAASLAQTLALLHRAIGATSGTARAARALRQVDKTSRKRQKSHASGE